MVPLLFRHRSDLIHKVEGLLEIGELKRFCDVVPADDVPPIHLLLQARQFLALSGGTPPRQGTQVLLANSDAITPPPKSSFYYRITRSFRLKSDRRTNSARLCNPALAFVLSALLMPKIFSAHEEFQ